MFIEIDVCVSVETFEDELDVFALERLWADCENGSVFPIFLFDPLLLLFVIAIKRIVNQFVGKQIGVYAPGYGRIVPIRFSALPKLPSGVNLHHGT